MFSEFIATLHRYRNILRIGIAYYLIVTVIAFLTDMHPNPFTHSNFYQYSQRLLNYYFYFSFYFILLGTVFVVGRYAWMNRRALELEGIKKEIDCFWNDFFLKKVPVSSALMVCLFGTFFFFIGKSMVSSLGGFYADPYLIQMDQFIHFGLNLNTVFPDSWYNIEFLKFIDYIYWSWITYVFGMVAYVLFFENNHERRLLYLYAYLFSWLFMGTFLALALSSCGPIFLDVYHPDYAAAYSATLQKIFALQEAHDHTFFLSFAYDSLLLQEKASNIQMYSISAMPSLHVAICWLNFLYVREKNKYLAFGFFAYFLLILFGSVFLMWHYAIDGYVSIIILSAFWFWARKKLYKEKTE